MKTQGVRFHNLMQQTLSSRTVGNTSSDTYKAIYKTFLRKRIKKGEKRVIFALDPWVTGEVQLTFPWMNWREMDGEVDGLWAQSMLFANQKLNWNDPV